MHFVLYNKPVVQGWVRPLARLLAGLGITANQVTVTNIMVSLLTYSLILIFQGENWPLLFIPAALAVRFVLNHVDGVMAVEHNMKSAKGLILNELGDCISDVVLYLPFALINGVSSELVVIMVVLALFTEITGLLGAVIGAERSQDGPMGKRPRGVIMAFSAFLLGLGVSPGLWINLVLLAMLLLLIITCMNRVKISLNQVTER